MYADMYAEMCMGNRHLCLYIYTLQKPSKLHRMKDVCCKSYYLLQASKDLVMVIHEKERQVHAVEFTLLMDGQCCS